MARVMSQPHNPDCIKNYLVQLDRVTRRVYPFISRRNKWDCPPCAQYKFGKMTQHLAVRSSSLCWGLYSEAKQVNAKRKGLGWLTVGFKDDARIMVAESHIYEPPLPSLQVLNEVQAHIAERQVTRMGWSDKWRPPKDGDPTRYEIVDGKTDDLTRVLAAIDKAGVKDGNIGKQSIDEVKSKIEQILNGVSF